MRTMPRKDEHDESAILMAWIYFRNYTRSVQIWEIELMIKQIREDKNLMIRIGKEQGWV
jgi:hypothetical protein